MHNLLGPLLRAAVIISGGSHFVAHHVKGKSAEIARRSWCTASKRTLRGTQTGAFVDWNALGCSICCQTGPAKSQQRILEQHCSHPNHAQVVRGHNRLIGVPGLRAKHFGSELGGESG